jgi:hypothetical protein
MKFHQKLALFSVTGSLLAGSCAVLVLVMAREPTGSGLFWKFGSAWAGAGLFIGGIIAFGSHFSGKERLSGLGNAIYFSLIPLILCALCLGALAQKPSAEGRRYVFIAIAGALVWWLLLLAAGIAQARGARSGGKLQLLLLATPVFAGCVAGLCALAMQSPEPGTFWSRWNGTRLVGVTILLPVCVVGLLLSLLDSGLVLLVGGFATALIAGALVGEWVLGFVGWPVTGAFSGGILLAVVLFSILVRAPRKRRAVTPQPPPHC